MSLLKSTYAAIVFGLGVLYELAYQVFIFLFARKSVFRQASYSYPRLTVTNADGTSWFHLMQAKRRYGKVTAVFSRKKLAKLLIKGMKKPVVLPNIADVSELSKLKLYNVEELSSFIKKIQPMTIIQPVDFKYVAIEYKTATYLYTTKELPVIVTVGMIAAIVFMTLDILRGLGVV